MLPIGARLLLPHLAAAHFRRRERLTALVGHIAHLFAAFIAGIIISVATPVITPVITSIAAPRIAPLVTPIAGRLHDAVVAHFPADVVVLTIVTALPA